MTNDDLDTVVSATREPSSQDWKGTASAETSVVNSSLDLHELAGLERDRWSILGIDVSTFSHGDDPRWTIHVYAFDRQTNDVGSFDEIKQLETERGSLPVTDIALSNVTLDTLVRCMKSVRFQLLSRDFQRLDRVERTDFPPPA